MPCNSMSSRAVPSQCNRDAQIQLKDKSHHITREWVFVRVLRIWAEAEGLSWRITDRSTLGSHRELLRPLYVPYTMATEFIPGLK